MEGSTFLRALRSTWWIVILAVLAGAGAAFYLGSRQDLRYQSVASYVVAPRQGDAASDIVECVRTLDQARARALASTLVEILTSAAAQNEAAASLGWAGFPGGYRVEAVVAPEAYVAELRVTGPVPAEATALAGAIGSVASSRFVALYPIYEIALLDPALLPTDPVNRGPVETAALGGALGLIAGLGVALLAGAPKALRRHRMQQRLDAYAARDTTVTLFPAERRTSRAG
jgi:capsular polysaccharide biosynthesis protein